MRGRPKINSAAPIRSSLADAAFAVEERLVWGGTDLLRGAVDAIRWPFERLVWAVERGLVWRLDERTGGWSESVRTGGALALALLAAGAGVLGLVWAAGNGGSATLAHEASAPVVKPVAAAPVEPAPVLHGPAPDFKATAPSSTRPNAASDGSSGTGDGSSETSAATGSAPPTELSTSTASKAPAVPAGPKATAVAHRFANAFVRYETGQTDAKVRAAFAATATPHLTRALLRRPPRLPANVKVPKAKVLNIVPGPKRGDTYTMSVSLLRVGVTSELRIGVERDAKTGEPQVKEILG